MGVVDERHAGCDGCGRTVPLEDLSTVTTPDGERFACCPQCEPHAREAMRKLSSASQRRAVCDGCNTSLARGALEDVVLADGTVVSCCPDCLAEVPGRGDRGTDTDRRDDANERSTTELASRRNRCSQCHEWYDVELFRVTLVDGRTEEFCPSCKDDVEERGLVNEIKMRKAEARELLGVAPDASDDEIREAFLEHVKHAHPDREGGTRSAFKLVKEAYDRLQ